MDKLRVMLEKINNPEIKEEIQELQDSMLYVKHDFNGMFLENQQREKLYNSIHKINKELEKELESVEITHQKLLEEYQQLNDENKKLKTEQLSSNNHVDYLNNSLNTLKRQLNEYDDELFELRRDKQYYMSVLNKLTTIIDEKDTLSSEKLSNLKLVDDIKHSPYYRLIEKSGLFDKKWYKEHYLENDDIDPITHFISSGYLLNYNPSPDFNTEWYYANYPYVKKEGLNPLIDYIIYGKDENRTILPPGAIDIAPVIQDTQNYVIIDGSQEFDKKWYKNEYNLDEKTDAVEHYLTVGAFYDFAPIKDFDVKWYKKHYNLKKEDIVLIDYILHDDRQIKPIELYNTPVNGDIKDTYMYQIISQLNLLNKDFYSKTYDVNPQTDLIKHFLTTGYMKGYKLNPQYNVDINDNTLGNPLDKYLYDESSKNFVQVDINEYHKDLPKNIKESIEYQILNDDDSFDEEWYNTQNPDVKNANLTSVQHYLLFGYKEGRKPNKNFDNELYYQKHPGIKGKINPLVDYILNGKRFKFITNQQEPVTTKDTQEYSILKESEYFDEKYYLENNPDVNRGNIDPLTHFLEYGWKENRNPNPNFNIKVYKKNNYKNKKLNPLIESIFTGFISKKTVHEQPQEITHNPSYYADYALLEKSEYFDETYYRQHNPNIKRSDAIEYYLTKGYKEDYATCKLFNPYWYRENNEDVKRSTLNPLVHYIKYGQYEDRKYRQAKMDLNKMPEIARKGNIKSQYDTVYESDIFDVNYYLEHYPEVRLSNIDPVLHYILYGAERELNPSKYFNTKQYLLHNIDVKNSNLNPLYHYIVFGKEESRPTFTVNTNDFKEFSQRFPIHRVKSVLNGLNDKISIIIPIYNAYEETKECIQSVLLNTHINYEMILINDCSTDKRIDGLLREVERIPFVTVINNEENKGFVKNVNIGLKATEGDVVLLNSDTIVTPRWLSQLTISAYSDERIATVTPFCNSSDISIPELALEKNTKFLNKSAYQLDKLSDHKYLESPTGNGFCLFIKREVIEDIGLFDEAFGKGYGEETDFTARAEDNGWKNIRNDAVFVYHRRHASFSKSKTDQQKAKNHQLQLKKHPLIFNQWDTFVKSSRVQETINNIKTSLTPYKDAERILYVTVIREGMPKVNEDFYKLAEKYDIYILTLAKDSLKIWTYHDDTFIISYTWDVKDENTDYFQKTYFDMMLALKIDLIYIIFDSMYHKPQMSKISYFIRLVQPLDIKVLSEGTVFDLNVLDEADNLLNPEKSLENLIDEKANYIDFKNKKTVIYTAITGNYDDIHTPSVIDPDFDYICFTDNPDLKSNFWQIRYMEDLDLDEIRKARRYKILPHRYLLEYDYSIWIDGNFDIIGDIKRYINENSKNHKLLAIKHEMRNCVYEEGVSCLDLQKDSIDLINAQLKKYRDEGYPEHNGLIASGILFRNHHDPDVIKVMEDWYDEIINYSRRDQLSFNYACWKNNFKYDESLIFYFKNKYFQRLNHSSEDLMKLTYDTDRTDIILEQFDNKISIIIPIYNAYEETRDCIESVEKYTNIPYELVLINDCSTDKRVDKLLNELSKKENVRVINNETNQGYVKNINIGFKETKNDVVLLNSDTIVTPKWLQKLKVTAYTSEKIATVTPVSNNAGAFSVPEINEENDIDSTLGINGTANIIEKIANNELIYSPTGNGFCMYIKRAAIYSAGFFDQDFGRGYCEENDYCMRLEDKGWYNVIDPSTYIYHNRSVSFSGEKNELIARNTKYLRTKHPTYKYLVDNFINLIEYEEIRRNIKITLTADNASEFNRKRVLYVIHEGMGGTLHTSMDLMSNIHEDMDAYLLTAGRKEIKLYKYSSFGLKSNEAMVNDDEFMLHLHLLASWNIKTNYSLKDPFIPEFRRIYFNILLLLKIDLVHIRHLIRHSLDMPYVAHKLGIPVILSFHDFYYICPSHNLIDDHDNYCAGHCTPIHTYDLNEGQCNINNGLGLPLLKIFVNQWREYMHDMFKCCSAFVTTSKSAYDLYTEFYPELKDKQFEIIEHGRDLKTPDSVEDKLPEFSNDEPIRILFPGHINVNKGGWLIRDIKSYDEDDKLDFSYIGAMNSIFKLDEIGTYYGLYNRSEFCKKVHEINPHFIGLLSIWPETYCHTLTEAWGCGIPVITLDIGALGERIHRNGGGFFIENDGKKAYDKIIDISKNPDEYKRVANQIPDITFKSTEEMSKEYMDIYKKYLDD